MSLQAIRVMSCALLLFGSQANASDCDVSGKLSANSRAVLAKDLAAGCSYIYLSSPGGDVSAALEMGREIRKHEAHVVVPRGERCASACVFLYAAGVTRTPFGQVQIHRPYHAVQTSTLAAEQIRYDRLGRVVRSYLRQMNVQESLFDEMMKISPESSRPLTLNEMQSFGLSYTDPVYAEYRDSQSAVRAGLTKEAFLRKKARATELCGVSVLDGPIQSSESQERITCWREAFPEYDK